jgi:DNA-binding beta-propeller fold protein YncE
MGLVGGDVRFEWTVAAEPVFRGVRNIRAPLEFPMFVDVLPDGDLVVSNFKTAELYRIDPVAMTARLLVDGHGLGLADMGNCVVDDEGCVWVNEVTGCRLWRFDSTGRTVDVLGDGTPGFRPDPVPFSEARFSWIYDIRRGPHNTVYVLDSRNFAVRVVDVEGRCVRTVGGDGRPGYDGDGGDARQARFGGSPEAKFDGPISLSVDERENVYIGDRFNHVVRAIDGATGLISTIAGSQRADDARANDTNERDPLRLNLPKISSMDYHDGRLFVPTDLGAGAGDLAVLRRRQRSVPA